jgi:hypothetical protein
MHRNFSRTPAAKLRAFTAFSENSSIPFHRTDSNMLETIEILQ